jgi:hypothetical protein
MSIKREGLCPEPDMCDMQIAMHSLSSIFDVLIWIDNGELDDAAKEFRLKAVRHGLVIAGELICDDFKRRY